MRTLQIEGFPDELSLADVSLILVLWSPCCHFSSCMLVISSVRKILLITWARDVYVNQPIWWFVYICAVYTDTYYICMWVHTVYVYSVHIYIVYLFRHPWAIQPHTSYHLPPDWSLLFYQVTWSVSCANDLYLTHSLLSHLLALN